MPPRAHASAVPNSAVPHVIWPALPSASAARRLSLLYQWEQSQWWPADHLRAWQMRQVSVLLDHAIRTVPFYGERLKAAGVRPGKTVAPDVWARIPVLTRDEVQGVGADLRSARLPPDHGRVRDVTSSGSTGKPVTVAKTQLVQTVWEAMTLRDHLWHRRDLTKKLAAIRSLPRGRGVYPRGERVRAWSAATASVYPTGPACSLSAASTIEEQALWLKRVNPDYLLTIASSLSALPRYCLDEGIELPNLRDVTSLGAIVPPSARALCRKAWGVPLIDTYSAQEVGYIALQCPEHEHFHVQAEAAYVEVLDPDGAPCEPGTHGRVVVTPLHNLAMPLIRYEIGDFAEVGEPCPCGRGLPVLTRILGRLRNLLTLPSGQQIVATFVNDWFEGFPVAQFQVVQRALDLLEMKIVPQRPFTEAEEARIRDLVADRLGPTYRVDITYHDDIPRGPGGKYEDFKSEL